MKFKCLLSGCVVEFTYEHDIVEMLKHPQYEVVEDVIEQPKVAPKKPVKE